MPTNKQALAIFVAATARNTKQALDTAIFLEAHPGFAELDEQLGHQALMVIDDLRTANTRIERLHRRIATLTWEDL